MSLALLMFHMYSLSVTQMMKKLSIYLTQKELELNSKRQVPEVFPYYQQVEMEVSKELQPNLTCANISFQLSQPNSHISLLQEVLPLNTQKQLLTLAPEVFQTTLKLQVIRKNSLKHTKKIQHPTFQIVKCIVQPVQEYLMFLPKPKIAWFSIQ